LLSTENLRSSTLVGAPKFLSKFIGPFPIRKVISPTAYELQLPLLLKRIHPVFHIHLLKLYINGRERFPQRIAVERPEPEMLVDDAEPVWEVESILKKKGRGRYIQYLVKWKDYPIEEATWEPLRNLENSNEAIQEFEERHSQLA